MLRAKWLGVHYFHLIWSHKIATQSSFGTRSWLKKYVPGVNKKFMTQTRVNPRYLHYFYLLLDLNDIIIQYMLSLLTILDKIKNLLESYNKWLQSWIWQYSIHSFFNMQTWLPVWSAILLRAARERKIRQYLITRISKNRL